MLEAEAAVSLDESLRSRGHARNRLFCDGVRRKTTRSKRRVIER